MGTIVTFDIEADFDPLPLEIQDVVGAQMNPMVRVRHTFRYFDPIEICSAYRA